MHAKGRRKSGKLSKDDACQSSCRVFEADSSIVLKEPRHVGLVIPMFQNFKLFRSNTSK